MKILIRIILLSLPLILLNCKESNTSKNSYEKETEYKTFVKYLKTKNISICELKEMRLNIKENAKNLADKKYPNSLAQHDKYIERIVSREIDTVREKYDLKSEDWIKAWRYGDKYCK